MFGKRFSRALAVTTVASLIMATAALANDKLTADADLTTSDADQSYTNTTLASGATATLSFSLYVRVQSGGLEPNYPIDIKIDSKPSWVAVHADTTFPISIAGVGTANAQLVKFVATGQPAPATGTISFKAYQGGTNTELSASLINTADSAFTVSVSPPTVTNTPPIVQVTGVTDGTSYEFGSVPAAGCSVTDTEDGNSTFAATLGAITGTYSAFGLGSRTASCSYTDGGGLSDSASVTYEIVDTTGPVVTAPADLTAFEGNTSGGATAASVLAALGSASATDAVFGDVSSSITNDAPGTLPLGTTTVTFTAEDPLGNTGIGTADVTVVDTTAPTLGTMPANMTVSTTDSSGKAVNYTAPTATDIVDDSPTVTCLPASGSTFALGATTVSCTAKDASDNESVTQTFTVTVNYYSSAFKAPINGTPVTNQSKGGRVIPVKVEVFKNFVEDEGTGPVTIQLYKSSGCSTTSVDNVEETLAAGSANTGANFRWEPDGGYWIYNLKAPTAQGCYVGIVTLDGNEAGRFLLQITK